MQNDYANFLKATHMEDADATDIVDQVIQQLHIAAATEFEAAIVSGHNLSDLKKSVRASTATTVFQRSLSPVGLVLPCIWELAKEMVGKKPVAVAGMKKK